MQKRFRDRLYLPGQAEMFSGATTNITSSDGTWFDYSYKLTSTVQNPAVISGTSILNIQQGQIHFPPLFFAKTDNPILLFTAEWTTDDFTSREVSVSTFDTTTFRLYVDQQGNHTLLPQNAIFEGSGVIQVVPAPSAGLLLVSSVLMRRRRK